MKIQKISDKFILEGSLLDQMREEEEEKERRRQQTNAELDKKQKEEIAAHKAKSSIAPLGTERLPDVNVQKGEIVDKLGEIVFYSLQAGDNAPKEELEALINKYSNYLKSKVTASMPQQEVKKFSNYSVPPQSGPGAVNDFGLSSIPGASNPGLI
jgi:hypothetical protein